MIKNYENFIKSKDKNILNAEIIKNEIKNDNSFNKNISNHYKNKTKSKTKDKNRNNIFKTINILHNYKKNNKDIRDANSKKRNKNNKILGLNLCCSLLNNKGNINANYKKYLNNKIHTYNFLNNNSSNEEMKKEKIGKIKRDSCHWKKKTKIKKNKKKNISQIDLTNLINNQYRINSSSLTKTKSTENVNLTKNIYNKSSDNETNFKNGFSKKSSIYETNYNYNFISIANSNNKNIINKRIYKFNKSNQNKNIKTNYNVHKSNSKNKKRTNRWTNSPGYNIYKNSEILLSVTKKKKSCKTPLSHKRLFHNIYSNYRNNKKEGFNLSLFDKIYSKAKGVLEQCKNSLENQIKTKYNL